MITRSGSDPSNDPVAPARSAVTMPRRPLAIAAFALMAASTARPAGAQPPSPFAAAFQALERRAAPLRPSAADLRYQQIPWVADPAEALRQARAERRPLFLWAAGGRGRDGTPLERC
jgi:hypothetical protein